MATLESLPADQRAVLDLVLQLGRNYDDVAELLSIERAAVRDRALAALDALGPQTRVSPERRALITDYLLDQLPESLVPEVRRHLAESASERAWARVVASELQPIAKERSLPEIPAGGDAADEVAGTEPQPELQPIEIPPEELSEPAEERSEPAEERYEPEEVAEPAAASMAERAASRARELRRKPVWARGEPELLDEVPEEDSSPPPGHRSVRRIARRRPAGVSRRGGAILLAGGALVAGAVVLVIILSGGSSKNTPSASTPASTPTTTGTSTGTTQIVAQINLRPPSGVSKAVGIAEVLRAKGRTGIAIVAQGLTPNTTHPANAYAVWLFNSPTDSRILGFVNPGVGKTGRLQTAGGLPTNASHFHQLLITLETRSNPRSPGRIVLQGPLKGL
jgi:hypothetical protein